MAQTTDLNHPDAQLRLVAKVRDRVGAPHIIFEDDSYKSDLEDAGGSVFVAAALRLTTIANSESYIQKVIDTLELKTDGKALGDSYRASAALLLKMVPATVVVPPIAETSAPRGKTYLPHRVDGFSRCYGD
jgi:hypothetical protein